MSNQRDVMELYSELTKVQIPQDKSQAIWRQIDESLESQTGNNVRMSRRKPLRRLAPMSAACAAVLILIGGAFLMHQPSFHIGGGPADTTGTLIQNAQPLSISSGDWKLVIYKSLEKPGPYYDMTLFYVGKKPLNLLSSTMSWSGTSTSSGGGSTPVRRGDESGGMGEFHLSGNLAKEPPLKASWTSSTGQVHKQTFYFSQAKQDVQTIGFHQYMGHNARWTVRYAYETLKGGGVSYPYGVLALSFKGKQMGNNISLTLKSPSGKMHLTESGDFSGNDMHQLLVGADRSQKGYAVTSQRATLTIVSQGITDTIPLTLQHGK